MIPALVTIAAILGPAVIYVVLAARQGRLLTGVADFFPLTKFIPADEYGRSTAAAGVSLATVILALVNLAPGVGIGLFVTVSAYIAGFAVLYFVAPAILRANPTNATLQGYLGSAYGSGLVKAVSIGFTFVGYVSIFSMELLVGVTVLDPIFPNAVLITSSLFLIFIIVYSAIGGFRAIVATEQWQIRFVLIAVGALVLVAALLVARFPQAGAITKVIGTVLSSWHAGLAFSIGIIAMNVPAAISDAGTWQRLCATKSEADARKGLSQAMIMFGLIWGTLILASCAISAVGAATGAFDPAKQSLMTFIVNVLSNGGILETLLLFLFVLGLFAALITTADSLLLVAAQLLALDVFQLGKPTQSQTRSLSRARLVLALTAIVSFIFFAIFVALKLNVVSLIFAIYGAQLALFPATIIALFYRRLAETLMPIVPVVSILVGFISAWIAAVWGSFFGDPNWVYNAPAAALVVSSLIFGLGLGFRKPRLPSAT